MDENNIGTMIVECAIMLHRELGPGLFESVYEITLAHELEQRNLDVRRQVPVPIRYKGLQFDQGFRADIIVENKVLLELKSIEATARVHRKQLVLLT